MVNIDDLKAELDADPLTRGYSGMTSEQVATSLTRVIDRTLPVTSLTASKILNAVDTAEYATLDAVAEERFWRVVHMGDINPNGKERDILLTVFPGGGGFNNTRAALNALTTRAVSRAVELGLGEVLPGHVEEARRLP